MTSELISILTLVDQLGSAGATTVARKTYGYAPRRETIAIAMQLTKLAKAGLVEEASRNHGTRGAVRAYRLTELGRELIGA